MSPALALSEKKRTSPSFYDRFLTDHLADRRLAEAARALGHPARVKILRRLLEKNQLNCKDFVKVLPWAQSTLSQHLKVLRRAGLIQGKGIGTSSVYSIDRKNLRRVKILLSALE
jgi:ArsR family transcriptional regulator, arsenate/arsenite/antimonite-responsive transcriptional repressor